MPRETATFEVEHTDTFGGEANYSWCRRYLIQVPKGASDAAIMRAAKKAAGLNGVRGRTRDYGEMLEFRPHRVCQVMFVTWKDPASY